MTISYNKLQADVKQGKSLDILLKKVKHQMVEKMSSSTADALGLSRAILCNGEYCNALANCRDCALKWVLILCVDLIAKP